MARRRKTPEQRLADSIAREVRRFDRALARALTPAARARVLATRAGAIHHLAARSTASDSPSSGRWRKIGDKVWVARDVAPPEIPYLVGEVSARGQARVGVTVGDEPPTGDRYDRGTGSALSYPYPPDRIQFGAEYARSIAVNLAAAHGRNPDLYLIEE